jgi:MFS family permease
VNFLGEGSQNKPMGMENIPRRTSHSVFRAGYGSSFGGPKKAPEKKTTKKGILLVPQPEESGNDPLNWPTWKRDSALIAVGLYCAVGGGMTPILAAGFTDVAHEYGINVGDVSLTTGLYMLGLGVGSVIWSPTAILFGKRPVYLASAVMFLLSNVWCAASHNFTSLILARIFQGIAISPVECLPSATVAEIYFMHERAFRLGIYTLLLLGGKNLVPLVSAAIISNLGWHWVFW